jgi:DNA-binding transcriptional regulator YbjK
MSYPELLSVFRDKEVINYIKDVNIRDVLQKMFSHYTEKGNLELNDFMQSLDKDELKSLVLNGVFDVAECTEDEINIIVKDYSRHLSKTFKKEEARKITERLSAAEKIGDVNTINKLLEKKRQILSFTKN